MFINRGEADPRFIGNIANGRTVKVGIGENLQNSLFESFVNISAQFI